MKTLIVNKATLDIESQYNGAPDQGLYGGPWGSAMFCAHIACPEELDPSCVKAEMQEDVIVIVVNEVKAQAKLDKQREDKLNDIRKLRDSKLIRVDQLINIAVLDAWTAPDKAELKVYRQALLDITESYKVDMSLLDDVVVAELVLPIEPTAE